MTEETERRRRRLYTPDDFLRDEKERARRRRRVDIILGVAFAALWLALLFGGWVVAGYFSRLGWTLAGG